jgi:hypothetical protein
MIVFEPDFAGVACPLDHPRIGARPLAGTVAASTEAAGFSAAFAANADTAQFWRPTAVPATWQLSHSASDVSYFGIASHDCGTVGATVDYQTWDGAAWVTMLTHAPTDNSPIFGIVKRRGQDRERLRFTGAIPTVGVIYFGDVTEFPRKADYVGSVSFENAVRDEYSTPVSDGGHWMGRFVTRRSVPARMRVEHLPEDWATAYLQPVLDDLKERPAFMADRPGLYPRSVVFAYTSGPVVPERMHQNPKVAIGVTFEVTGNA